MQLIRNENMKIYRRPRTWLMAAFVASVILGIGILMKTVDKGQTFDHVLEFMQFGTNLTFLVFVFSVVIASEIVAGEFTWGTIKLLLIRPATRSKILLSKYIAVLIFLMFLLAIVLASSALFGLILFGVSGTNEAGTGFGDIFRTYGFKLIDLVMNVTFAFMISTVFRSSALAIALSFIIMFASGTIMTVLIALKYTWAKYILFANTDLSVYFGGRKPPVEGMTLGFSITMLLVYYAVFVGLAWTIFRERDVAG